MDEAWAVRLVEKLRRLGGGGDHARLLAELAACDAEEADAAVRAAPEVLRALARYRAERMTRAELTEAIARGADLDALPLDDALYAYIADRDDGTGAAALDRLCKRDGGFERAWFEEHADERLRRHAIARAGDGDPHWFEIAARGGGRSTVELWLEIDDADVGLEAARVLALGGHRAAVARLARDVDPAAAWPLCAAIAAARKRGDGAVVEISLRALDRLVRALPDGDGDLALFCRAAEVGCAAAVEPIVARIVDPRRFGRAFDDAADRSAGARLYEKLTAFARLSGEHRDRLGDAVRACLGYRAARAVGDALLLAAELADPALIPTILATYDRTDRRQYATERAAACAAIGAPARLALEAVVCGARDPDLREQVAQTLVGLADPASIPALLAAADDPEPAVRITALDCLSRLARPPTDDVLAAYIHASQDADPGVRVRAAQLLNGSRDPRARDALRLAHATADPATQARLRSFVPRDDHIAQRRRTRRR